MASQDRRSRRAVVAAGIGTVVEYYDLTVYAYLAVVVSPLFFPSDDPTASLLSSLAVFASAYLMRPIGGIFFGRLGDRFGRKATLVGSLLTMGVATFLIGCLPTFHDIGWWAALLLLILRLFQGFALGGEWSGAALVATENAPKGKRAWYGTFPQLGAPIGFIIANTVFLVIYFALPHPDGAGLQSEAFLAWGWRVPFLLSAILVVIAGLIGLCALITKPWAYAAGWVLQVLVFLLGFFTWAMFVLGVIFGGLWFAAGRLHRELRARPSL